MDGDVWAFIIIQAGIFALVINYVWSTFDEGEKKDE